MQPREPAVNCLKPEFRDLGHLKYGFDRAPGAILLSRNESPDSPGQELLNAAYASLSVMNRYPDATCSKLRGMIASSLMVQADGVWVGNGSASLLPQILQLVAGGSDEVLFSWPSFELYPALARAVGAVPVPVLGSDANCDLTNLITRLTSRTRMVIICNPNNPTSTALMPSAVLDFVRSIPSNVMIVFDEAYIEYADESVASSCVDLVNEYRNVVVLRTFSKAYGLAGLRVGYAVAAPEIIAALSRIVVPFQVSTVAQEAACHALSSDRMMRDRVRSLRAERSRVTAALRGLGFVVPDSQTNFVWLALGINSANFVEQSARAGIEVYAFGVFGVRVTVGCAVDNGAFLAFAEGWKNENGNKN